MPTLPWHYTERRHASVPSQEERRRGAGSDRREERQVFNCICSRMVCVYMFTFKCSVRPIPQVHLSHESHEHVRTNAHTHECKNAHHSRSHGYLRTHPQSSVTPHLLLQENGMQTRYVRRTRCLPFPSKAIPQYFLSGRREKNRIIVGYILRRRGRCLALVPFIPLSLFSLRYLSTTPQWRVALSPPPSQPKKNREKKQRKGVHWTSRR